MKLIKWGKKKNDVDLSNLEVLLESTLQPVNPRVEFVNRLRYQIRSQYQPIREDVVANRQRTVLLVGASAVGGLLTLVMGIRIVMTLVAAIALMLQWKRNLPPEQVMATRRVK
jgi:hypothetical protein